MASSTDSSLPSAQAAAYASWPSACRAISRPSVRSASKSGISGVLADSVCAAAAPPSRTARSGSASQGREVGETRQRHAQAPRAVHVPDDRHAFLVEPCARLKSPSRTATTPSKLEQDADALLISQAPAGSRGCASSTRAPLDSPPRCMPPARAGGAPRRSATGRPPLRQPPGFPRRARAR